MNRQGPPGSAVLEADLYRALRALGGRGTRGDLVLATGYPLESVDSALHSLMADGRVEVTVTETAVLVYRLGSAAEGADAPTAPPSTRRGWNLGPVPSHRRRDIAVPFDRKTLRLIRAREGVISIAELVEHTGLTVKAAEREAERLVKLYGGEAHPSWDGHIVYAFPEMVASAHGDLRVREPRPAWVRCEEPMSDRDGGGRTGRAVTLAFAAMGLAWFASAPPEAAGRVLLLAAVAGISAGAAFVAVDAAARVVRGLPWVRVRRAETLRRYLLGYVFETALRGKGVVSLSRAVAYLKSRTGLRVSRRKVDRILQTLAIEFDATELTLGEDRFFGFRNVKRQFLASHVQRVRLRLERRASGSAVFDSGDDHEAAADRELELFDRDLLEGACL
ncbi:MAG: hypothetical protein HKN72_09190 [Gemmatimonadetes bacterium]|nr:hypothetical protein [Gemmatimonadota bacterium]